MRKEMSGRGFDPGTSWSEGRYGASEPRRQMEARISILCYYVEFRYVFLMRPSSCISSLRIVSRPSGDSSLQLAKVFLKSRAVTSGDMAVKPGKAGKMAAPMVHLRIPQILVSCSWSLTPGGHAVLF